VSDDFIGEIRMFMGSYVPQGWLACDGSVVSGAQYAALQSLIGGLYGSTGDAATFKLPDLRGRAPFGAGVPRGAEDLYTVGEAGGAESVVLTPGQMPAHTHGLVVQAGSASTGAPEVQTRGCRNVASRPSEVRPTGAGVPVPTMPPFVSVQFIICWDGFYPTGLSDLPDRDRSV
jgi:microcystin-dependent protein